MAAQSEVIYPPRGVQLLDGGLNTKFEPSIIGDNESPDCANVVFTNGSVGTRGGVSKLNTTAVGSYVCDGLYTRRADTGAETMVAFFGGTMWQLGTTTFSTVGSAQSVFTAGIRVAACQYRNNLFIGNGYVIPYKYNGTDFTRHGVYPPVSNTVALSTATGGNVPVGDVTYYVTFRNSYTAESDISTGITFSSVQSGTVSLVCLPVGPQSYGVASRRIYRKDASGTTALLVTTLNDNTTTTYTDTSSRTSLTSTAPTDNGVPPKFNACIYAANRLFVNDLANPNYVWYSELAEPFTFPSTNFFKVGDAASDLVKGFEIQDNAVVCICENSHWLNIMGSSDDADWAQVRVRGAYGSKSPFGTWHYDNKIGFPAYQNSKFVGFAAIRGADVEQAATILSVGIAGSDLTSDKIETDMFDVVATYTPNISSMVYKNKAYITLTKASGNTTNNRVYLFDFSTSNLSKSQKYTWAPISGINAAQFTIYDGKIYAGDSTATGFVRQLETTSYNDDSSAINSYFWTKEFSGQPGHENLPKDFRKLKLLVDLAGVYYMEVRWVVDSDSGVGQVYNVNLDPDATTWNNFTWGVDTWGGGSNQREIEIPLGQTFGKRIKFKFSNQNTANQRFKVHRLSYTYNLRGYT